MSRTRISTGTPWEPLVGYSRAVRDGRQVFVTGTTATLPQGGHAGDGDAYVQARQALANIGAALERAGSSLRDVVRTRIFVTDIARDWPAVGRAHAEALGDVRPATTMVQVARLIEDWMLVEIEADALVGEPASGIEEAGICDRDAIAALLAASELPVPGPEDGPVPMLVVREGDAVVACAGWERHGSRALLRSLAVRRSHRGQGHGRRLAEAVVTRLAGAGSEEVWLLTTTAAGLFEKLGFTRAERAAVPPDVARSREITLPACSSAVVMRRGLSEP